MKIYLAGPCDTEHRTIMVRAAKQLRNYDNDVYCPWELKIENAWDYTQEDWAKKVFDADIKAINECDIVIMISVGRESTAGTNWEQGYAYGINKTIYVIQITDKSTSLMTYCGCTTFINSTEKDYIYTLAWIDKMMKEHEEFIMPCTCTTILT